jgi:glycosyltransferase involved in cell wall biosynthesis
VSEWKIKMPKLSIITVNLNNKAGLIDTAQSVVAQTWTDYEWIIIDGGSTDGSVEVIKEYADKTDKLVYWCSEPDGGVYLGMNKGIEKVRGEYCWFLNSGDYAYKNTTLAEIFANEFHEDIVYGDHMVFSNSIDGAGYTRIINYKKRLSVDFCLLNPVPQHQATLIKLELFIKYGNYQTDFQIIADRVFFMKVLFVENILYKYLSVVFSVFDLSGISCNSSIKAILEEERKRMLKSLFPNNYKRIILKVYILQFFLTIKTIIKNVLYKVFKYGIKKRIVLFEKNWRLN